MALEPHVWAGSLPNASQIFCHDFAPIPFIRNRVCRGNMLHFVQGLVPSPLEFSEKLWISQVQV
ncbi:hypothetical protein N182_33260 [Sinorhizobium sp. GL2]|nr:hypothetical protein N182_33260 [Sinorhizobium sp. GL2]